MKIYSFILLYCFVILTCTYCKSDANMKETNNTTQTKDTSNYQENDSIVFISKTQFKNGDMKLGMLTQQKLKNIIQLNGTVEIKHSNHYNITLPFGGRLKKIYVSEGNKIKEGDTLGIVENPEFINIENEFLKTKENIVLLENEFKNKSKLYKEQAISEKEFLKTQTDYNIAKINLKSSAEKLSLLGIEPENFSVEKMTKSIPLISPCNCALLSIKATLEDFYSPNDIIIELRRDTAKHLHLRAFEKYVDLLKPGQTVTAFTNYAPDTKYNAVIKTLNFSFNETKSVDVHCNFLKYYSDIIPGLYMTADVEIGNVYSYCLPQSSIVNYLDKNYIFIQDLNNPVHFDLIKVDLGIKDNELVEIKNYKNLLNRKILISGAYKTLMQLKNTNSTEEE